MDPFQHGTYFTSLIHDGTNLNDEVIGQSSPISPQVESTTKKRGGNFTLEEDLMIISAWLNISLDAVQGNEQKSKTYWQRVSQFFHEFKPKTCPSRSQNSLMNRWSAIQLATNKFCGCFAQIERLNQSGLTEKDKIRDAKNLYKELHNSSFQYEHCWNELRYQPKWMEDSQAKKQKTKYNATPGSSVPSTADSINLGDDGGSYESLDRPPGRKAEKARLRKSKSKEGGGDAETSALLQLLAEMKEEKKVVNEKKFEMMEKCYLQEQQRLMQEKEKMQIEQLKEEDRIMSMDLGGMSSVQTEYYRRRQMEILEKKM
ncbi:Glutathione transferase protein [Dioscorea alata]|uniref:Glutathione transferase protein n=2 Tax=Dioscorea alata TaxID=55571 RepID=A0ACB7WMI4_DIOAL|nr:Glutathione transferase protein [Dioscorea alata]KAH7689129.1 Glutathione transferase protein [Dioscorea alata]